MVVKLERLMLQILICGAVSRIATSLVGGGRIGRCEMKSSVTDVFSNRTTAPILLLMFYINCG